MTPAHVKFELQKRLVARAVGGRVPAIVGIHSVLCEGDVVFVNYDLTDGELLDFEFARPQLVSRDDIGAFTAWLAFSSSGETAH